MEKNDKYWILYIVFNPQYLIDNLVTGRFLLNLILACTYDSGFTE